MEWLTDLIGTLLGSNIAWGTVIVLVLARLLPNSTLEKFFSGLGEMLSGLFSKYSFYQKIEDWFIDGLAVSVTAFIKGLRKDNPAG